MSGTVVIAALGAQGDGVLPDGGHLPFTLPGEEVRLPDGAVLTPAPERVTPPCRHFGRCGGCAVQHASDAFVAAWKRDLVLRALAQRGIAGADVLDTLTSPPASRRRAAFAARRTRSGAMVGFHARGSDEIVPLDDCRVVMPAILATLPVIAEFAALGGSRRGAMRYIVTDYDAGPEIVAERVRPAGGPLAARLAEMAAAAGLSRLVWDGETLATLAPPVEPVGRARVPPPPGAFLQATRAGAAALLGAVAAHLGGARRVADLFAGCGTFTLPLAEGAEMLAVEADGPSLAALEAGWRGAEGLRQVRTERRDLFRRPLLAAELAGFEGVVIDPPRQGAKAQVAQLAASDVPRIAMVSCNPATFARDARVLIDDGYRLGPILPVDQFRWSPHVELAAGFARP